MAAILEAFDSDRSGFLVEAGGFFCRYQTMRVLRRLFDLPADPAKVWVTLHARKSTDRVPVKVSNPYGYPILKIPGWGEPISSLNYDVALSPYVGKNLWLQVEYEE